MSHDPHSSDPMSTKAGNARDALTECMDSSGPAAARESADDPVMEQYPAQEDLPSMNAVDMNSADSTQQSLHALPTVGSLALSQVGRERRPRPSTVCEVCPASVWSASPHDLQCYCRIMHIVSWSNSHPYHRIACDGIDIATQQE